MSDIGIYKIENSGNGKVYVGRSKRLSNRYRQHVRALRDKDHYNTEMLEDFIKYGESSFTFHVLETCDESSLDAREWFWMGKLNSFYAGYNKMGKNRATIDRAEEEDFSVISINKSIGFINLSDSDHGGKRNGAGRKSGPLGPTKPMRIPVSIIPQVNALIDLAIQEAAL